MHYLCYKHLGASAMAVVAALAIRAPSTAHAQGMNLKQGWNYAIGFSESVTPGSPPGSPASTSVATYRVLGSAGDQQWYRVQMVARKPQGGWYIPQGTPEIWINLSYAIWVQEIIR